MCGSENSWWGLTSLVPLSFQAKRERQANKRATGRLSHSLYLIEPFRVEKSPCSGVFPWFSSAYQLQKLNSRVSSCILISPHMHQIDQQTYLTRQTDVCHFRFQKSWACSLQTNSLLNTVFFFRQRSFYLWNPVGTLPASLPLGDFHRVTPMKMSCHSCGPLPPSWYCSNHWCVSLSLLTNLTQDIQTVL